ncbi:ATP phosphoribosyltransferase regulatory subunit [Eubacterium plexicaudatum ASF492]|uniref:ATP phosphoribosyltransferase regulatory subunit n=1 Tax=Eubacterium plexicaudatum ASF492 TaxID=1235802 RepID=N2B780_9FIRM|nr:ATP phosphoribosyltransferase regulatory subunit [Eubacterium plexicaudatum ASF492]
MKQHLLHTPEGVRDIYQGECEKKLYLEDKLFKILKTYGYQPIQTPSFEYFDIFGKEIGTTKSKDLYKFFDREGNTLVLRPDITPSIARVAANYFMEDPMPIRFCYKGNTFINTGSLQGRLKENTQLGAELIGDNTPDADAEILSMVVDCLIHAGLKEFKLSVGHVGILQGMMEAAGFDEEEEDVVRDLIMNNNFFGVDSFLEARHLDQELKRLFSVIGKLYQSAEEFQAARAAAEKYPKIQAAMEHLEKLQSLTLLYGIDKYISFELGVVSSYKYYSGMIFHGYTFGSGEPIVKGGRYDRLLKHFGKDTPAIGFVIVTDQLMAALSGQKIETPLEHVGQLVVYDEAHREDAVIYARRQRAAGCSVELLLKAVDRTRADYEAYAGRRQIARLRFMDDRQQ